MERNIFITIIRILINVCGITKRRGENMVCRPLLISRLVWMSFLILYSTGCEQGKFIAMSTTERVDMGSEEPEDRPEEELEDFSRGQIIDNCLETSVNRVNACIFGKNLVSDAGQSLPPLELPVINLGSFLDSDFAVSLNGLTDMSSFQTYAVHIPGDKLLENDNFFIDYSIFIRPLIVERTVDGDWKHLFPDDSNFNLLNTHTFFWVNHLAKVIKDTTGSFYAEGEKVGVHPFYPIERKAPDEDEDTDEEEDTSEFEPVINAFWLGRDVNLMVFGVSKKIEGEIDGQEGSLYVPLGFDTGVVAHEVGHAILDYASPAEVIFNEELERKCGPPEKPETAFCSRELKGGPRSIHEGVGDIVSIFLFPQSTAVGEIFVNHPHGLLHCGLPRDVEQITAQGLTAQDLFDACSDKEIYGEIHAHGSVYSTIWYGVFQKALARGGEEERKKAYQLFFEHLKNITSNDTFETLRATVKTIDENLFNGQFSTDWDAEYRRLGYD